MAKERKSFLLRVDPKLHDALRRWADDDFRSLNAQIEMLLRQVVHKSGRLKDENHHEERQTEEGKDD
jgi:hypothetical protein